MLLDSADTRLDEAGAAEPRSRATRPQVSQALDAFTQEAISGSDLLVSDYQSTGDPLVDHVRTHLHRRRAWRG